MDDERDFTESPAVAIYEARYGHLDDTWDYYPMDQLRPGVMDILNQRGVTEFVIKYEGDLTVRWRKRMVDEDTAYAMEEDYMNYIANRS